MRRNSQLRLILYLAACLMLSAYFFSACSSTSALKDDEQLFTGLKPIEYTNYESISYVDTVMEEMEYALASAPTGALLGSSYYRTPFPVRLWIWNAFSQSEGGFSKWMAKTFGSKPKLMANVNPQLRAQVAEHQLAKYGYFNSKVDYEVLTQSNPKEAKVAYKVNLGHLWTLDSVSYQNFPTYGKLLIDSTMSLALIHKGSPFNVSTLEAERQRLTRLFRNNGFYYYQNGYASYLADTVNVPGKVDIRLVMADSIAPEAKRQWYIGSIRLNFRRQLMEEMTDSFVRRYLTLRYTGKKIPIRAGVVLRELKLRPRRLYMVDNENTAKSGLQSMGLFSYTNIKFSPRSVLIEDSLGNVQYRDTLDADVDLVFDKPYDFYVEANAKGKTTGRVGPELVVGLTKRNAFRGGEKLDFNVHGSHEWQTIKMQEGGSNKINSYEFGSDLSVSFPGIITPWNAFRTMAQNERRFRNGHMPRRYYGTPTTTVKAAMNILNRAGYFRRHVASGELTYNWATSYQHHHSFSPLILSYEYMNSTSAKFDSIMSNNLYVAASMLDRFVPKMSYTYTYKSPQSYRNPIVWSTTVSEAGNVLSLCYLLGGYKWNEKNKRLFKNEYSQFVKLETDFVKYWRVSDKSTIVGHVDAGVMYNYGNSDQAPYTEMFYVGGANSIRAFSVRGVGPGNLDYSALNNKFANILRTGDIKLQFNLEYRPRLYGDLYGALFLDAGNVWLKDGMTSDDQKFKWKDFYKQMAVGTGGGLRYDMGMFVVRVDWGVGLHLPYNTSKKGFYNIPSFKDAQSIHLAVGYPF